MTREEAYELIGPYVDGDLPEEVRHRLETILFSDRDLAWDVQTLVVTRARLREGVGEVVASDSFRARALARLQRDNPHLAGSEGSTEQPEQYQLPIRI
jgi:anti-sigma factor RsiW